MNATDLAVIGEGLTAGLVAGVLFQWVGARIPRVDFWKPAAALARSLVEIRDEDDQFFARYGQLLKLLARYLGRQAVVIALPLVVVSGALLLLPPSEVDSSTNTANLERPREPAPRATAAGFASWVAPPRSVEVTSLICVCVGSGIGMSVSRKRT